MPENRQKQLLMELTVNYGTRELSFDVTRSQRKTLQIEVHPDLSVRVIAPEKATETDIQDKVLKRSRWILKQQTYFEQFLPRTPQRKYVSGETHLYLGKRYILRIRSSEKNGVKLKGGELFIFVRDVENNELVKRLLTAWYYHHAKAKFEGAREKYLSAFRSYNIGHPPLEIKRMARRWGSCTPNGRILLNPELIKTPTRCIEYVVVHELCHLVYPFHNKAFYQLQEKIMPDWMKWKGRLEVVLA